METTTQILLILGWFFAGVGFGNLFPEKSSIGLIAFSIAIIIFSITAIIQAKIRKNS